MTYRAKQIADFFITLANNEKIEGTSVSEEITHLKLQKILYFAQSAFLALDRGPLFSEKIEAWKLGPVVPAVYRLFREKNGALSLTDRTYTDFSHITAQDKELLTHIWHEFGKYSAKKLVDISHEHTPWRSVFVEGEIHALITQESLKEYYAGMFSAA